MCDSTGSPALKLLLQAAKNQIPRKIGLPVESNSSVSNVTIVAIIRKGTYNFFRSYPPPTDSAERKRKSTGTGSAPSLSDSDVSTVSTETIQLSQQVLLPVKLRQ